MKKWFAAVLMVTMLCAGMISAQASQKLNIYLEKNAILAHHISAANIRIRPEGMVCVTQYSLWPWDEEGTKWSMFVEIENISDEKIVIDEDWLIACKANQEEFASASYVFESMTNAILPGEKTLLYAGVNPYVREKHRNADINADVWDVEGLSDFADRIRQAEILRVRLDVRGDESTQYWKKAEIQPKVRIEGRTICLEWKNETDESCDFRTIGAILSDDKGRIFDVISLSYSEGASAAPGETLGIEKELLPYVTQEQIDGAVMIPFAYLL